METVIVDTSAIYALLDRADENHGRAKAGLEELRGSHAEIIVTNFVMAESHALILSRLGHELARRWLAGMIWRIERVSDEDESRAREIVFKYIDKDFSLVDAVSFAVMKRLGLTTAFAFDRHFLQFGFALWPRLEDVS